MEGNHPAQDNPEEHLKDELMVGNLPLRERRIGSVRTNRSTDLQEVEEEEEASQ